MCDACQRKLINGLAIKIKTFLNLAESVGRREMAKHTHWYVRQIGANFNPIIISKNFEQPNRANQIICTKNQYSEQNLRQWMFLLQGWALKIAYLFVFCNRKVPSWIVWTQLHLRISIMNCNNHILSVSIMYWNHFLSEQNDSSILTYNWLLQKRSALRFFQRF